MLEEYIKENFNGILAVGDIHGNMDGMVKAVNYAYDNNLYFMSLGDIMDYGDKNFGCLLMMQAMVEFGKASMVIGNHDEKFQKYLNQYRAGDVKVQIKGGIVKTVDEFEKSNDKADWYFYMDRLTAASEYFYRFSNLMFAHAAIHHSFWNEDFVFTKKSRARALFGQIDPVKRTRDDGYPNRIYDWVDDVSRHNDSGVQRHIVVGHAVRSEETPVLTSSFEGGPVTTVFLDTGSSKGGKLSGAVYKCQDNHWYLNSNSFLEF